MSGSGPYSGLIIRSPVNPFPKRPRSQNLRPSPQAKSTRQKKRSRSFESCFHGREDVFAFRWEGKGGKSGYSPAGSMDWRAIHAAKPEDRKRVGRKTRILQPLTDDAIRNHLTGKQTIGIYPLLPDETCWFLAVDFDKKILDGRCGSVRCIMPAISDSGSS